MVSRRRPKRALSRKHDRRHCEQRSLLGIQRSRLCRAVPGDPRCCQQRLVRLTPPAVGSDCARLHRANTRWGRGERVPHCAARLRSRLATRALRCVRRRVLRARQRRRQRRWWDEGRSQRASQATAVCAARRRRNRRAVGRGAQRGALEWTADLRRLRQRGTHCVPHRGLLRAPGVNAHRGVAALAAAVQRRRWRRR